MYKEKEDNWHKLLPVSEIVIIMPQGCYVGAQSKGMNIKAFIHSI